MNTLNLRIIHTHDVQAVWDSESLKNFVPKAGELIVYDIDETYSYERFKIGDGVKTVAELPFTVDSIVTSLFNINNNTIYADAGRITNYEESIT